MPFNAPPGDSWIRLGLAHLSSVLKAEGHEVSLIDFRMIGGWRDFRDKVTELHPDIVFITAFTSEMQTAIDAARTIKSEHPKTVTCIGGIHASIAPEDYQKAGCFDFIIRGEGEITVPHIAGFAKQVSVIGGHSSEVLWGETPDLNSIPFADRELWPNYAERIQHPPVWLKQKPWIDVLMARGCPHKCKFCSGPGEQNHFTRIVGDKRVPYVRGRSVDNVIRELTELDDRYHYRSIHFDDDQFIMNIDWTWKFMKALKDNALDTKRWWAGSRADVILRNKDLVLEMRDCGMEVMSVGFESFSDELLQFWGKGTTVQQNFEAAQFLNDNGIKIFSNTIMGAPRPDGKWHIEDDERNLAAMKRINPAHVSWSIFTAVPGSELYQWCIDKGLVVAKSPGFRGADEDKIKGINHRRIRLMMDTLESTKRLWYHTLHDQLMLIWEGE
jgi:anaerobic magnesium-protoporphyrin IX monomethyl ester cyclase